ncbi:hypothetical protein DYB30_014327, partial [Aphanomyces astaci]
LSGQGHKELIPFTDDILVYMRKRPEEEKYVRVFHLMQWVKRNHMSWLTEYFRDKNSEVVACATFRRLLLRIVERHRFRLREPCISKVSQQVLHEVWLGYAATLWNKYEPYEK